MGLDFLFDKDLLASFGKILDEEQEEGEEIDYTTDIFKNAIAEFVKPKNAKAVKDQVDRLGYFDKGKDLTFPMFMAGLDMEFDSTYRTLISTEPFGIAYIGDKYINRKFKGYTEWGTRKTNDYFNIYFETDAETWFFFQYKKGILNVLSSDKDFNNDLASIKPNKTFKQNKAKGLFFQYQLGSTFNKENFVARMEEIVEAKKAAEGK